MKSGNGDNPDSAALHPGRFAGFGIRAILAYKLNMVRAKTNPTRR